MTIMKVMVTMTVTDSAAASARSAGVATCVDVNCQSTAGIVQSGIGIEPTWTTHNVFIVEKTSGQGKPLAASLMSRSHTVASSRKVISGPASQPERSSSERGLRTNRKLSRPQWIAEQRCEQWTDVVTLYTLPDHFRSVVQFN